MQHFELVQWPILLAAVGWPLKPIQAKPLIPDLNMKTSSDKEENIVVTGWLSCKQNPVVLLFKA